MYKKKLEIIKSHYSKSYQEKRLDLEMMEYWKAVCHYIETEIKKRLQLENKEKFVIEDSNIENVIDELADVCVLVCQINNEMFEETYQEVFEYTANIFCSFNVDIDFKAMKSKVFERFLYKIDRQIERISNEKL